VAEHTGHFDANGNPCTLDELCRKEPAWAATRIRALTAERNQAKNDLKSACARRQPTPWPHCKTPSMDGCHAPSAAAFSPASAWQTWACTQRWTTTVSRSMGDLYHPRTPHTAMPARRRKHRIAARWGTRCCWCNTPLALHPGTAGAQPTIEHLVPRALGGNSALVNLRLACEPCNARRGCRCCRPLEAP
jgi:hypothetical protein